jgi:hypothetical protein
MAEKQLTPVWWQHGPVCTRRSCRNAVRDALTAIDHARDVFNPLTSAIAARHGEQVVPVGWRSDSMASIHMNDPPWWATEIVSRV